MTTYKIYLWRFEIFLCHFTVCNYKPDFTNVVGDNGNVRRLGARFPHKSQVICCALYFYLGRLRPVASIKERLRMNVQSHITIISSNWRYAFIEVELLFIITIYNTSTQCDTYHNATLTFILNLVRSSINWCVPIWSESIPHISLFITVRVGTDTIKYLQLNQSLPSWTADIHQGRINLT